MQDTTIAIIDDHEDILELLQYNFERERFRVHAFTSGYQGMDFIVNHQPDAVICDWMLDDIDGIEICRSVKRNEALETIPFIILTARNEEIDAVIGLEIGADDYVTKPVRVKELIARVNKFIKRNSMQPKKTSFGEPDTDTMITSERKLNFKGLTVDTEKYKAYLNNRELNLTHSEFKLLQLFANKPGKVFTRNQIIEKLNGFDYIVTERSIDVQIVGLRKKLGKYKDYLETVRGVGYCLKD